MTNEELQNFDDEEYYDNKIKITLKNGDIIIGDMIYYSYQEDSEDTEFDSICLKGYTQSIYSNEIESVEIIKE